MQHTRSCTTKLVSDGNVCTYPWDKSSKHTRNQPRKGDIFAIIFLWLLL